MLREKLSGRKQVRKDAEVSGMIYARPCAKIDDVQEPKPEPEKLEKEGNDMYKIVGIIDGHYIVETRKGLKKVKISGTDNKKINDKIIIEKL